MTELRPRRIKGVDLRKKIGERSGGYSQAQGCCTDGTYAYYLLISSSTQRGRILRVRRYDHGYIAKSDILDIIHGNGMAFDAANNRLVVTNRGEYKSKLTLVDAESLKIIRHTDVTVSEEVKSKYGDVIKTGFTAIAYDGNLNCYIALMRVSHDFAIISADFKVIAYYESDKHFSGTYQAMDADSDYIYLVLSPHDDRQPHNIIAVFDRQGHYVTTLRTNVPYENESLYHVSSAGVSTFYLVTYRARLECQWKLAVGRGWEPVRKYYYTRRNYVYNLGDISGAVKPEGKI